MTKLQRALIGLGLAIIVAGLLFEREPAMSPDEYADEQCRQGVDKPKGLPGWHCEDGKAVWR